MKALHVIAAVSPKYGGPSLALPPMCKALIRSGVRVQIAATDAEPGGHLPLDLERPTLLDGVPAIFFRKQWSEAFKYSRSFSRWLVENVSGFDVVHIHGVFSHACLAAANACRQQGVPYIIRPLGNLDRWSLDQKPVRKKVFFKLGGNRMLHGAAAIHYASSSEKQSSETALGINHGVVIPLGVELDTEETNSSDYLKVEKPYVLALSRLQPTKGIDTLVDAFLEWRKTSGMLNWQLRLAGEGPSPYVAQLKRKITEQNAGDAVVLTGWLDGEAKAHALRGASLLALPSQHESFGLCIVEALACGIPVLVSPEVSLATDIKAADAGWVSRVNTESLVDTLRLALSDPAELARRGAAARKLAQQFSWPGVAESLGQLYASVTARSH